MRQTDYNLHDPFQFDTGYTQFWQMFVPFEPVSQIFTGGLHDFANKLWGGHEKTPQELMLEYRSLAALSNNPNYMQAINPGWQQPVPLNQQPTNYGSWMPNLLPMGDFSQFASGLIPQSSWQSNLTQAE